MLQEVLGRQQRLFCRLWITETIKLHKRCTIQQKKAAPISAWGAEKKMTQLLVAESSECKEDYMDE